MISIRCLILAATGAAFLALSAPTGALSFQTDGNGRLVGATDVRVNGTLYDVVFKNGTCIALFSGCDGLEDFVFADQIGATNAAVALRNAINHKDTDPHLRQTSGAFTPPIKIITPYRYYPEKGGMVSVVGITIAAPNKAFLRMGGRIPVSADTTPTTGLYWALWHVSSTPSAP